MADALKTTKVEVAGKETKKTAKGSEFWNITTEMGVRFTIWDKGIADVMVEGDTYPVKYSEKQVEAGGKSFTNRTIEAVEIDGKWVEQAKKSFGGGGFKSYDSEGMRIGNAINGAVTLVGGPLFVERMAKKTNAEVAEVVTFFINHLYNTSKRLSAGPAVADTATNGAAKATKKAAPVEQEEEVEMVG